MGVNLDPELVRDRERGNYGPVVVRDADLPLALLASREPIYAVRPMRDHDGLLVGLAFSTGSDVIHIFNLGDELRPSHDCRQTCWPISHQPPASRNA